MNNVVRYVFLEFRDASFCFMFSGVSIEIRSQCEKLKGPPILSGLIVKEQN